MKKGWRGEGVSEKIITHGQREVYGKAFETAMVIFNLSSKVTKEEPYSLTDQISRSSRSG